MGDNKITFEYSFEQLEKELFDCNDGNMFVEFPATKTLIYLERVEIYIFKDHSTIGITDGITDIYLFNEQITNIISQRYEEGIRWKIFFSNNSELIVSFMYE